MGRTPPRTPGEGTDSPDDPSEGDAPAWRAMFRGASPREILARLCEGDPLELVPRANERLRELDFLLPGQRVWARAAARVAYAGMRYRGHPPLTNFLTRSIDLLGTHGTTSGRGGDR